MRVHSELKSRPNLTKVIQRQILETSLRFPLPNSSQLQVHSLFQMANTSAVVHEPFTFRELHENGEIPLSVRKEQWQGNYKEAAIFLEVSINSNPSYGYRCFYLFQSTFSALCRKGLCLSQGTLADGYLYLLQPKVTHIIINTLGSLKLFDHWQYRLI